MADKHRHMDARDVTVSAGSAVAVSPSNDTPLTQVTRGLYVGGAGTVRVTLDRDSSSVDFVGVVAGSVLPIRVKQVHATGTDATNIVALY